jgi:hypothetical protein
MDHNQQGQSPGRRHFHRGRRGPDRRGPDRRGPDRQPQHSPEQGSRNDLDVEQIMRDIRARIAQRNGIELTNQQIQELAARRLESILDPRTVKPALLDQLRRSAGAPPESASPAATDPAYSFDDSAIYESHRGLMRFFRKLLNPILKLFFNPNPMIQALSIQARLNTEAAAREATRDRRQAEWNALHYELLQRVVTEIARVSLEAQSLSLKVDALAGRVDFNERRVRGIEGTMHQTRPAPSGRRDSPEAPAVVAPIGMPPADAVAVDAPSQTLGPPPEGGRRRRRRRRGRRGTSAPGIEGVPGNPEATTLEQDAEAGDPEGVDIDEGPDDEPEVAAEAVADERQPIAAVAVEPPQIDAPAEPSVIDSPQERRDNEPEG